MKVLLFSEGMNLIKISGLGRAIMHQQRAMELNGIEYTLNPKDSYDVVHINTLGLKSKHLAKKGLALDLDLVRDGFGAYHAPTFLSPSPRNLRVANIEMAMRTSMTRAMKDPSFHCDWEKWR